MATKSTISLKLLVDNTSKRVVFAEAGKEFVDFLFGLLELPLGSLIRLLEQEGMAASWSFGKVYESVKNLDADYLQREQTKQILLAPNKPSSNTKVTNHLLQELGYGKPESSNNTPFGPSSSSPFVSAPCTLFASGPSTPFGTSRDDNKKKEQDGYVKGMVTYLISDDLTVKPLSPISTISLMNSMAVKDIGSLEDKNVEIDVKKALELVKTSFESSHSSHGCICQKDYKKGNRHLLILLTVTQSKRTNFLQKVLSIFFLPLPPLAVLFSFQCLDGKLRFSVF